MQGLVIRSIIFVILYVSASIVENPKHFVIVKQILNCALYTGNTKKCCKACLGCCYTTTGKKKLFTLPQITWQQPPHLLVRIKCKKKQEKSFQQKDILYSLFASRNILVGCTVLWSYTLEWDKAIPFAHVCETSCYG